MRVLQFRPRMPVPARAPVAARPAAPSLRVPGSYAGRARFTPLRLEALPPELRGAVGRIAEFGFAGIAPPGDSFSGQALYLEWRTDDIFDGFVIPEQDLEFVEPAMSRDQPLG